MRFICSAGTLATEVGLLLAVAGKRTVQAICGAVHIRTDGDSLILTATDFDCTLRVRMPAEITEPGSIALDAKRLHGLASSFEATDRVSFTSQKDHWMSVECRSTKVRVPGIAPEDFPGIPERPSTPAVSVPADAVVELLRRTSPSGNMKDQNWAGMRLVVQSGAVAMASTDGHRMTTAARPLGEDHTGEIEIVASRTHFEAMSKLLSLAPKGAVELQKDERRAYAHVEGRLLIAKLDDKRFPDPLRPITNSRKNSAEPVLIDRKGLARMVERAAFVAGAAKDDVPAVLLRLAGGRLEISAEGGDSAEVLDVMDVAYAGKEVECGYAAGYLRDFLTTATAERVKFAMNLDETTGSLLHDEEADHICIVMGRHMPKRVLSSAPAKPSKGAA